VIDTLSLIDTYAAAGYNWLFKAQQLLMYYHWWFIGAFLLAGSVWSVLRLLPDAIDGRIDPVGALVKYWLAALIGLLILAMPVVGALSTLAPNVSADNAKRIDPAAQTPTGALLLPSYLAEMLGRDAVTVALAISNPGNQALVQVPAAQLAANRVMSSALGSLDGQLSANLKAWRDVVAPTYLARASPQLRARLEKEGLMDAFLDPVSDVEANSTAAKRARRVAQIISDVAVPPLADVMPEMGPLLGEALGGAQAWSVQNGAVQLTAISQATKDAAAAPPPPPPQVQSNPAAMDAFKRGNDVLRNKVLADPLRQLPSSVTDLAQLYTTLGRATDVAAAYNVLRDPFTTTMYGATCQRDATLCQRALVDAQAAQAAQALPKPRGGFFEDVTRAVAAVATIASRVFASVLESIITAVMPAAIGYGKAVVALLAPVAALLMMWPGRFVFGLKLTVGAHVFIALWTVFYVIWDRFTAAQLNSVTGIGAVLTNLSVNYTLASNLAQLLVVGGYLGLTAFAYAIASGAADAVGGVAAGAGGRAGSVSESAGRAAGGLVSRANTEGGAWWSRTRATARAQSPPRPTASLPPTSPPSAPAPRPAPPHRSPARGPAMRPLGGPRRPA
jgi:hypothetical protein